LTPREIGKLTVARNISLIQCWLADVRSEFDYSAARTDLLKIIYLPGNAKDMKFLYKLDNWTLHEVEWKPQ
jgi:hypothetical protein